MEEGNISLFGRDLIRFDGEGVGEGVIDLGDLKVRIKDGSFGLGSNEGIGNNVSVRDIGEVINV